MRLVMPKGRPKLEISVWDKKYYSLDPERDKKAVFNTKQTRLTKAYTNVFILAHEREPGRKQNRIIERAVADIINRI
jgi:hypothetical protein